MTTWPTITADMLLSGKPSGGCGAAFYARDQVMLQKGTTVTLAPSTAVTATGAMAKITSWYVRLPSYAANNYYLSLMLGAQIGSGSIYWQIRMNAIIGTTVTVAATAWAIGTSELLLAGSLYNSLQSLELWSYVSVGTGYLGSYWTPVTVSSVSSLVMNLQCRD